jgi:chromosome segregation ATPase
MTTREYESMRFFSFVWMTIAIVGCSYQAMGSPEESPLEVEAYSNESKASEEKLNETSLEAEVEDLEVLDEKERAKQTANHIQSVKKETNSLRRKIGQTEFEKKRLQSQIERQGKTFDRSSKLAEKTELELRQKERERDKLKLRLAAAVEKLAIVENRVKESKRKRDDTGREIKMEQKRERVLIQRRKEADALIARYKRQNEENKSRLRRLSKSNRNLESSINQKENQASRLKNRTS